MLTNAVKGLLGLSKRKAVRILMYHQVLPKNIASKNDLIVTTENLEKQFIYIKNNFTTLFFKELDKENNIPNKIILTFDDGYYNNLEYLVPLLEKYQLKATIFILTEYIQNGENSSEKHFMSFDEIRNLNPELIEIALHSHSHKNYSEMSVENAREDLKKNIEILKENAIKFSHVLAYPYGKFPKEKNKKRAFFEMLEQSGITAALRIGNEIESFPWKNKFEIKRIDIKYGDSIQKFKWKLRLGKLKL
ncbi:polysaccharide deacetylase family protein [Chryseobacterium gwangjuense]|uniref:polysaccharide deacetylase family protein n=1 Tax=Chryseobacterium gwangjuense TaxID=1069980 RepID=UPI001E539120|nr:polysaccharide deacetylase family protein [Chryseobacterium gwangjuense]MCE3077231.1 polysaccharide deacetylase family protein [Chryseobacterium gwangjuense]